MFSTVASQAINSTPETASSPVQVIDQSIRMVFVSPIHEVVIVSTDVSQSQQSATSKVSVSPDSVSSFEISLMQNHRVSSQQESHESQGRSATLITAVRKQFGVGTCIERGAVLVQREDIFVV
jgi:predicted nucleic acid-binding protein